MKVLLSALFLVLLLPGCDRDDASEPEPAAVKEPIATDAQAQPVASNAETSELMGIPLEGMFRYLADAPQFRDCSTGKTFPVAMAGPYLELERAYLNSGTITGEELKVALHGRFLERPAMESNTNEIMLIVDSFQNIIDSDECKPALHADLQNTYWKLVDIGGITVTSAEGEREAHLVLDSEGSRVHGFAGCNNFFGQYENDGENLTFSSLGATRMACPDSMETEQAFLQALDETDRAVVSGMVLQLFSFDRQVVRLEAVYLP